MGKRSEQKALRLKADEECQKATMVMMNNTATWWPKNLFPSLMEIKKELCSRVSSVTVKNYFMLINLYASKLFVIVREKEELKKKYACRKEVVVDLEKVGIETNK